MHHLSAKEIREQVASGQVSAVEVTEHFLNRIDQYEENIGAFLVVLRDRALEKAQEVDAKRLAGKPLGKLAGVPIAIKDNIHIEGEITTCASKFLTNFTAPFSATVVELLEAEDAILIGKTNLDEFAMGSSNEHSALKDTGNPWNLAWSTGGSSGGSAAAVAGRMAMIALGSDTGGSIRQPASLCGIVGMKPTYGRVSRYGLVAFGSSLDQIGPFATCIEDASLVMEVLGQHCSHDSTSLDRPAESYADHLSGNVQGLKIGVPFSFLEQLDPEAREAFDETLEIYKSLGATVHEVDLSMLKYSIATYYILATAEASTNLARFDGVRYGQRSERAETLRQVYDYSREDGFGDEVKRRILLGTFVLSAGYADQYYRKAQRIRRLMVDEYERAFNEVDVIMTPTTAGGAFERGIKKSPLEEYLEDLYTIAANLAGLPAVSIPVGFTEDGKPLGTQITGPQGADVKVCQAAYAHEKVTDYHNQMPEGIRT